jgi:hypothetical protein
LPRRHALVLAALLLVPACGQHPAAPDEGALTGTWVGSVPRRFYVDDMRLELTQAGRALAGQGVRGRPCPADGTCYADVTVAGTLRGNDVTLLFGPPFGDRFEGNLAADGTLQGRLMGYDDRPLIELRRIRD